MENFKTSLNKLNFKLSTPSLNFGKSPETDWKIIFLSATILSILAVVLCGFIFIKIDKGDIFVVEETNVEEERTLNIELLKETVSYYQGKAREFQRLKSQVVPAIDPSL